MAHRRLYLLLLRVAQLARQAGDVDHPQQLALRADDGAGGARQLAVALQVVLAAAYPHRAAEHQRGTDGVGAAHVLAPVHARQQRHPLGAVEKGRMPHLVEDHAVAVGDDHHVAVVDHAVEQRVDRRSRQLQPVGVFLLPAAEAGGVQLVRQPQPRRGQAEAEAAPPRVQDRAGHAVVGQGFALEKAAADFG
ncbi:hypothetical protein D3C72_1774300 [compost metagenome]